MAVSGINTHVRYHGSREGCERLRPWGFHLAGELARDIDLNFPNSGNDNEAGVRSREFGNGEKIRVLIDHDFTWIDIYSPDGGGAYEVIEETKIVYDLYMDPILYFDTATELRLDGDDEKCRNADEYSENECYSQRLFERVEIARDKDDGTMVFTPRDFTSYSEAGVLTYDTKLFSKNMALNKVCYPFNRTKSHGVYHCYSSWSKTLDQYTAHAILYYNADVGMNMWCVAYDLAGVGQTFRMVPGGTGPSMWPQDGYLDMIWCSNTDVYNTTAGYKAFDLWKEDVLEDSGETVPHVFLSIAGDAQYRIHVFDLTATSYQAIDLEWPGEYEIANGYNWPYYPEGWKDRHIRLIGLVKRTAYFAVQDHYYGVPVGASGTIYWENDTAQGSTNLGGTDCGIQFAILNEFDQSIEWMDDIACQVCEAVDGGAEVELNFYTKVQEYTSGGIAEWSCSSLDDATFDQNAGCDILFKGEHYYPWTPSNGLCPNNCRMRCYDEPCEAPGSGTPTTFSYFEDILSGTKCTQSGLESGEDYLRSSSGDVVTDCWSGTGNPRSDTYSWWCTCNGVLENLCHTPYGGPNFTFSGTREDFSHWITSSTITGGHVLPYDLGVAYEYTEVNGSRVNDTVSGELYDDVVATDGDGTFGNYTALYSQPAWPFYPQYAIMVSGEVCNKPILTEKKKYTKPGDKFIDGLRIKPTETFMDDYCRLSLSGDNYSIVLDNNGTLHDNMGNTFNRAFEETEVGLFFLEQRRVKTRRINENVN